MAILSRDAEETGRAKTLDWAAFWSSPWALAPILLAAFLVYAPTLRDWFTGDDFWFLRASQTHSVGDQIWRSFDYRNVGSSIEFDRYRPLYPIAWRLEYAAFGMHAFYYHAVVLALHVACTAVVWCIARRLFRDAWAWNVAALIFAVHPAYVDAVAWISGANRVFAALPYLLAFLCFMKSLDERERHRGLFYGATVVLFVVAVLFHSASMTLAAVLPAYAFLVAGDPRDALRPRAWIQFLPFALLVLASALIQSYVRANLDGAEEGFRFGYHQYANYGGFLGRAIMPVEAHDISGRGGSILDGLQGVASILLLAASVGLLTRRPAWGVALFAVFWFYIALLPDSTLVLGPSGRAMYLAGAALAFMLVAAAIWLRDLLPAPAWATAVRIAPYALALAIPLVMFVAYGRTRGTSHDSSRNEAFISALRRDAPELPAGTLYIANAPSDLTLFGTSSRLDAIVELYYGPADVRYVPQGASVPKLGAGDRLYNYTP